MGLNVILRVSYDNDDRSAVRASVCAALTGARQPTVGGGTTPFELTSTGHFVADGQPEADVVAALQGMLDILATLPKQNANAAKGLVGLDHLWIYATPDSASEVVLTGPTGARTGVTRDVAGDEPEE